MSHAAIPRGRRKHYEKEQIICSSYGSMSDRSKPCRMRIILKL